MKKLTLYVLILAGLYIFTPLPGYAAGFDLSVSPPILQIELTPPAVADVKQKITLENTGDDPMDIGVVFRPFKPLGESGSLEYLEEGNVGGDDPLIFQRIKLLQDGKRVEEIHIPPKTKKNYDFSVTIPKDEPPSDYYFTMLFVSKAASGSAEGSVSRSVGGVGMNVLLSIGPKAKTQGTIEEFSTDLFRTEGPVPFTVKIHNASRHFIYPKANIVIKNMFGQIIGKVELLPVNILADSTRALPSKEQFVLTAQETDSKTASKKQSPTIMKLLANADKPVAIWPEKFLLGPYRAELTVALSEQGPLYVRSITFIGFPIHILIGFGIAIMLVLIIHSRLKHHKRV